MMNIYEKKSISKIEFKAFCNTILTHIKLGKVSREAGCKRIAGLMFRPDISEDTQMEDICLVAGELELPNEHISDIEESWAELKDLVTKL